MSETLLPSIETVAVVGAGVVGRGWIPVFLRGRCTVRVFDVNADQLRQTEERLERVEGLSRAWRGRVTYHDELSEALSGAQYVQESTAEVLKSKRQVFAQLDQLADVDATLASSTSTLDINAIAEGLRNRHRCVTAHPFNPPSIIPVVEMLGVVGSGDVHVDRACQFLTSLGQRPVRVRRFVPGYLGNRLQAAIMREAIHLVVSGIANVDDVDLVLSHALSLRWAALGVFGTNHTNADGGLREYYRQYWPSYIELMKSLNCEPAALDGRDVELMAEQIDRRFHGRTVEELAGWRDHIVRDLQQVLDVPSPKTTPSAS